MSERTGEAASALTRTLLLSSTADLVGIAECFRIWSTKNIQRIVVQVTWAAAENRNFLADALETLGALRRQLATAGITLVIEFIADEVLRKHHGSRDLRVVAGLEQESYQTALRGDPASPPHKPTRTDEGAKRPNDSLMAAQPEAPKPARRLERRNVSVRYFSQMNPGKVFPLLVILSRDEIKRVADSRIAEAQSVSLETDATTSLTIEPIVPGCTCYPARTEIRLDRPVIEEAFWLVPEVVGVVEGAQVELRQNGKIIESLPLNIRVRNKAWVWIWAVCAGVVPILSDILSLLGPSLSPTNSGASVSLLAVFSDIGGTIPAPAFLALFAALSVAAALLARPKQEQSFWDVAGIEP